MQRLVVVVLAFVAFAGCKKDDGGGDDTQADAAGSQPATDVTGDVTTDTTWSGLVRIHSSISVAAGVTLTVEPGTTLQFDGSAGIKAAGTVNVNGAKGNVVTIQPAGTGHYWAGWSISTGTVDMTYVESRGGGFSIGGTGMLKARDSEFSNVSGDLLVAGGGTIDMQYSWIGLPEGQADSTHCDMHFEGGNPTITVSHSNISTSSYGIMFYSGHDVDLTYNNWFANSYDVDKSGATTGSVSNGYFKKGAPTGVANLTADNLATSMVADAGPR